MTPQNQAYYIFGHKIYPPKEKENFYTPLLQRANELLYKYDRRIKMTNSNYDLLIIAAIKIIAYREKDMLIPSGVIIKDLFPNEKIKSSSVKEYIKTLANLEQIHYPIAYTENEFGKYINFVANYLGLDKQQVEELRKECESIKDECHDPNPEKILKRALSALCGLGEKDEKQSLEKLLEKIERRT
jgi:hypothetical protein